MNKVEITTKAFVAGMLGAILSGVIVIAAEQAICYDVAIGVECDAGLGLMVVLGIPASVFLIIFTVLLRSIPDFAQYDVQTKNQKEK